MIYKNTDIYSYIYIYRERDIDDMAMENTGSSFGSSSFRKDLAESPASQPGSSHDPGSFPAQKMVCGRCVRKDGCPATTNLVTFTITCSMLTT